MEESRPARNNEPLLSAQQNEHYDQQHGAGDGAFSASRASGSTAGKGGANPPEYTPIMADQDGQKEGGSRRKSSSGNGPVQQFWLWEVLSIIVAILALAAMVIVLVLYDGRTMPKWPSAITINALIAVFSAILKACLVMPLAEGISQLKWLWYQKSRPLHQFEQWDMASRGPWGSFLLIFALKGRDLAVFGAVLTLAAMAVDPFVQQVVQYYSCPQMINGEIASIPYSNNYTDGAMGRPTGSPSLDSQMQSALFVGLLDPPANVSAGLAYTCRTGNCTFPATEDGATFMSLSMGSTCRDITDNISYALNTSRYSNGNNETYTFQTASLLDYDITIDNETAYVMYSGYQYSEGWPSSWLTKAAFLMGPNPESGADKWSATAFECEFYPTVSTWASNITNSVLVEHVVETVRMDVWAVPFGTHSLYNAHRTIRNGTWHTCENTTSPSAENDMPVVWWPDAPGPTVGSYLPLDALTNRSSEISTAANYTSWWPSDCVYSLPYVPTAGLAATIRGLVGNESLYWDAWTSRPQGDLWMVSLWNNGSATSDTVQLAMDGLSHSVTARLRTGDAGVSVRAADGLVQGSVWEQQTCVRARWLWLTLPAAMVALTTAFLVLTAVRTSLAFRRGGENSGARALVWKSSPLAVLFNGLDEGTREATGPVTSLRDMQAAAEQTRMQLKETPNGYRLVGTRL